MSAFAAIGLSVGVVIAEASAQITPEAADPSRREIMSRVVEMLRWKAYWEGPESFHSYYKAGKRIDTKIVRTSAGIGVFMAAAGVNFDLHPGISGVEGTFGPFMVGQTNDQAAVRYLANTCGAFQLKSAASPSVPAGEGSFIPTEQVCLGESPRKLAEEDFRFILPVLPPPDYVLRRTKNADVIRLREIIDRALRKQLEYQDTCKSATVIIPIYSSTDPSVYVYVDMGQDCEDSSGIFEIRHRPDGDWDAPAKLWSVPPPNDWSWTIQQIKRSILVAYEVR